MYGKIIRSFLLSESSILASMYLDMLFCILSGEVLVIHPSLRGHSTEIALLNVADFLHCAALWNQASILICTT